MLAWRVGRSLLDIDHEHEELTMGEEAEAVNTQPLRIAAIFVILSAGLLGGFPPLFMKLFRDQDGLTTRLLRAFSAGVILTLALVHIIPEALEKLGGLLDTSYPDFPIGGVTVLFGVALMVLLEHLAHIAHLSHTGCAASPTGDPFLVPMPSIKSALPAVSGCKEEEAAGEEERPPMQPAPSGAERSEVSGDFGGAAPHGGDAVRQKIIAYMFELGCIIHSFIIGLALGVNKTDLAEVRALLIALAFHQWLEGVSLASVILRGGFPVLWKGVGMVVMYSLTCPIGIAIGMGISDTYDGESVRARAIEGTFDGVSGGMLLYISLVQLLAEDMMRLSTHAQVRRAAGQAAKGGALQGHAPLRLIICMAFWGGAAAMCILAIWA